MDHQKFSFSYEQLCSGQCRHETTFWICGSAAETAVWVSAQLLGFFVLLKVLSDLANNVTQFGKIHSWFSSAASGINHTVTATQYFLIVQYFVPCVIEKLWSLLCVCVCVHRAHSLNKFGMNFIVSSFFKFFYCCSTLYKTVNKHMYKTSVKYALFILSDMYF